jgi:hypothetical protein
VVYSDASKKGFGYVLMQHDKMIAYTLKQLKSLWDQLSGAWFRNSRYSVCFKIIKALFIWVLGLDIYKS